MSSQAKIGRNQPCPCESGKKYKHCHGRLASPSSNIASPEFQAAMRRAQDAHEAHERLRTKQQGHGRPIISVESHGYRIVAIGSQFTWSKRWMYFTDFLLDYLKDRLGREWGERQKKAGSNHPVFRWLGRLGQAQRVKGVAPGAAHAVEEVGWLTALFGLGYSLYLIAHHDQLAPSLLRRLREEATFRAAAYETLVAAAFAKAGYGMRWAELGATGNPTPEFWATAKSGKKFSVEAKCKDVWRANLNPADQEFINEIRQWLRDQLYKASKKNLKNPIYWFELSIPAVFNENQWRTVHEIIVQTINDAESMTVAGAPVSPAYVFVTNHVQLVNDYAPGSPLMAMLEGFGIPDLKSKVFMPFDAAMVARDRHRDVAWVFDCLKDIQRIPVTFDGHPSEMLDENGQPLASFRIGDLLEVPKDDGTILKGIVEDVSSLHDHAHVVLFDNGIRFIAVTPLTPQEAKAVAIHGDAIFGKPRGPHRNLEGDPLALYDWFLEVYTAYPRDVLLRQMAQNRPGGGFEHMTNQELATHLARGYAAGAFYESQKRAQARTVVSGVDGV